MYCGQCGKKVLENMLFCPFCGSPIVIPDQDEAAVPEPAPVQAELIQQVEFEPLALDDVQEEELPQRPVSLFEDFASQPRREEAPRMEPEPFEPLRFDFDEPETERAPEEEAALPEPAAQESAAEPEPAAERPVRRPAAETHRPGNAQKRAVNTYIPVKELSPDDIFMDEIRHEDDYDDDYDEDDYDRDDGDGRDAYIDDFEYEEQEHGGFFQRHIRGIVGLILLLVMAIICAIWGFSPKGQLALARVNLAWTADAYADLGYDAYMQNSDLLAARYYEKALSRDETNYEYAHSAMVAYYEADEIASAAAMLKRCIEMDPDNPEPYQEMLILYPDARSRPWEISELIRLGYQRTGDPSLNLN